MSGDGDSILFIHVPSVADRTEAKKYLNNIHKAEHKQETVKCGSTTCN